MSVFLYFLTTVPVLSALGLLSEFLCFESVFDDFLLVLSFEDRLVEEWVDFWSDDPGRQISFVPVNRDGTDKSRRFLDFIAPSSASLALQVVLRSELCLVPFELELDSLASLVTWLSMASLLDLSEAAVVPEVMDSGSVGDKPKDWRWRLDKEDAEEARLDRDKEEELEEEEELFSEREEVEEEREEKEEEVLDRLLMVKGVLGDWGKKKR